jgi:nitrogenase molybdenum-iron protein beta chain
MLDYTPKEMAQRETLVINPAKICQPIGAILAYKGIHNCMPITHGSQGIAQRQAEYNSRFRGARRHS